MYCCSAPTTRRAIWNFASSDSQRGRLATIRLCSSANSVCVEESPMFSFARTSPATKAFAAPPGASSRPISAIGGAVAVLPRASPRGK